MKDTGQRLREKRESLGITLNEVSAATKINLKTLEAIERGDSGTAPSKTFLRGFVQTYAIFLKMDVKEILDLFTNEMGHTNYVPVTTPLDGTIDPLKNIPSKEASSPAISGLPRDSGPSFMRYFWAGLVIALLLVIYLVAQTIQKYSKEKEAAIVAAATPVVTNALPTVTGSPSASASASPGLSTSVPVVALPINSPSASPIATTPPKATATPLPTPKATPTPAPSPIATATPAPKPSPSAAAVAAAALVVVIEALDSVTLDVRLDGGAVAKISLQPDQKREFRAEKIFVADVSDGGAITVFLNGKDRGVPGDLGKPIKIRYP